ncbi:telomerase Cajal body protein 1 homolog [Calliphora vicina]|uniref:telomerase Cajal body protein 1 homolog n=1 Tax=Calliphora vicina TaxID=7373 RepID=UPI00325B1239
MNLKDNSLNCSERSAFSECILEESTLNNNVNFSKLDFSHIATEESSLQISKNMPEIENSTPKLSITLEQEERDILRKRCVNGNTSQMDVTEIINGSLQTTNGTMKEATLKNSRNTTTKEITMEVDQSNGKEDDDSVIPIDEDDDVEEISTLECSVLESPKIAMFSHLQPNNTAIEKDCVVEEITIDPEIAESILEQESSQFIRDESKLFQCPFIEVGRRLWPSTPENQQYTKGCLWSPDGTCLLVPVHLDGMHIVELPTDLYTVQELNVDRCLSDLTSAVHVKEGGTVYDCCWYPYMNSSDPVTCSWLATRQHEPIHMWDAFTGELRCSYRGYNEVDEVESAISIVFSNDGEKVIGGFKKTIKIFDTIIPGRACSSIPVKKAVSCFALTTENDNCVTAGTWSGYINHYDLRAPKLGPLFTLGGHSGGITWLKYSPTQDQNWYLFSGARRDDKILQWDMRNYTEPVQIFERKVQTNQRIYFDLTPLHTWIATGDTEGLLRIYNLGDTEQQYELPLHQDCCNGISFHPSLPIITSTSGQYHFVDETASEADATPEQIVNYENSLLFLWYGSSEKSEH